MDANDLRRIIPGPVHDAVIAERDQLRADLQRIDSMLRYRGVPESRAASTYHALSVLLTRLDKEIGLLSGEKDQLRARVAELEAGLECVTDLISNSDGVAGLHLNGDIAPWNELRTGGRFEHWLSSFDAAIGTDE